jgi:hypothetical protein
MDRTYIVRLNIQKWMADPRAASMFAALPFYISVLISIMIDNWWVIAKEDMAFAYETIIDAFESYDIDDDLLQQGAPTQVTGVRTFRFNPTEPWYDLIVQMVIDFFDQTRDQLYPIFNDAGLVSYAPPAYDGMIAVNACSVVMRPIQHPFALLVQPKYFNHTINFADTISNPTAMEMVMEQAEQLYATSDSF